MLALPNQRWSLDVMHDQFVTSRPIRVLNIVDDVTRERMRAMVEMSISGRRLVRELANLIVEHGRALRSSSIWPAVLRRCSRPNNMMATARPTKDARCCSK